MKHILRKSPLVPLKTVLPLDQTAWQGLGVGDGSLTKTS